MPDAKICGLYPVTYAPQKANGGFIANSAAVIPPFLAWVPTRSSLLGTPTGSDFGTYEVVISGTYNAPGWFGYSTWSANGTIIVPPPTLSFNSTVIHLPAGNVDTTVRMVVTPECTYTIALTVNDPTITLNPPTVITAATTGMGTFTINTNVDTPRSSKVTATITPRAPSTEPAVVTSISVIVP
jgi:hypothetical protein